jgi:hypothetical protein
MVALTSVGCTSSPPLATTLKASSICSALTATPEPIGMEPIDVPDQSSRSSMMPAVSSGNPRPVGSPRPKRVR